jgi:hypothetical protein
VPHEYLPEEQASRYGRFAADPTADELEKFFFLDGGRWHGHKTSGGCTTGWAGQSSGDTVRLLGTFLTDSDPAGVPEVVMYGDRQQTPHEHAWEIRDLLEYREGLLRPGPVPGLALHAILRHAVLVMAALAICGVTAALLEDRIDTQDPPVILIRLRRPNQA